MKFELAVGEGRTFEAYEEQRKVQQEGKLFYRRLPRFVVGLRKSLD